VPNLELIWSILNVVTSKPIRTRRLENIYRKMRPGEARITRRTAQAVYVAAHYFSNDMPSNTDLIRPVPD